MSERDKAEKSWKQYKREHKIIDDYSKSVFMDGRRVALAEAEERNKTLLLELQKSVFDLIPDVSIGVTAKISAQFSASHIKFRKHLRREEGSE